MQEYLNAANDHTYKFLVPLMAQYLHEWVTEVSIGGLLLCGMRECCEQQEWLCYASEATIATEEAAVRTMAVQMGIFRCYIDAYAQYTCSAGPARKRRRICEVHLNCE